MDPAYQRFLDLIKIDAPVSRLIKNQVFEDQNLDYKFVEHLENFQVPGGKKEWLGLKIDFALMASELANTDGGIIVWNVKCQPKESPSGRKLDLPEKPSKISHSGQAIKERLLQIENSITDPIIIGIRHEVVEKDYVISYIPKSPHAPHRCKHDNQYYFRVGCSKEIVPHGVLERMFLARQKPLIEICRTSPKQIKNQDNVTVGIVLKNLGSISLKNPTFRISCNGKFYGFLSGTLQKSITATRLEANPNADKGETHIQFNSERAHSLHPGGVVELANLSLLSPEREICNPFHIEISISAEDYWESFYDIVEFPNNIMISDFPLVLDTATGKYSTTDWLDAVPLKKKFNNGMLVIV